MLPLFLCCLSAAFFCSPASSKSNKKHENKKKEECFFCGKWNGVFVARAQFAFLLLGNISACGVTILSAAEKRKKQKKLHFCTLFLSARNVYIFLKKYEQILLLCIWTGIFFFAFLGPWEKSYLTLLHLKSWNGGICEIPSQGPISCLPPCSSLTSPHVSLNNIQMQFNVFSLFACFTSLFSPSLLRKGGKYEGKARSQWYQESGKKMKFSPPAVFKYLRNCHTLVRGEFRAAFCNSFFGHDI